MKNAMFMCSRAHLGLGGVIRLPTRWEGRMGWEGKGRERIEEKE